ncbi:MAG: nitroreductase family protein [Candidatus Omnitrophica bacterium]|nr:nitroreductase family protein [Candidatus Omnitrophota bacterium]MCM8821791.1 nitroreductase family protein [Candidatus Omnitrophota bacterium]MCM8828910.1 nitroreductase family protein [Candidatus Omnitrophota bacterium]
MDFYQVIKTRRSVRAYKRDEIPQDVLERVLNAARIAPSGSNRQPWKFILIKDRERKRQLAELCHHQSFIAQAPVVIAGCGRNIHYNRGGWMGDCSVIVDVAIAFDHLTLAARAQGLGTCWIGSFDNEGIKKYLGIPDDYNVVALTPVGYPEDDSAFCETQDRLPLQEIVFYEQWGKK